jgi:hypothetical protein
MATENNKDQSTVLLGALSVQLEIQRENSGDSSDAVQKEFNV